MATDDICSTDSLDSSDMPHLFSLKIDLSHQVILDITDHQAVRALWIHEVAHTLRHGELSLAEGSLFVARTARTYLLKECVSLRVNQKNAIVGGVCDDQKFANVIVW